MSRGDLPACLPLLAAWWKKKRFPSFLFYLLPLPTRFPPACDLHIKLGWDVGDGCILAPDNVKWRSLQWGHVLDNSDTGPQHAVLQCQQILSRAPGDGAPAGLQSRTAATVLELLQRRRHSTAPGPVQRRPRHTTQLGVWGYRWGRPDVDSQCCHILCTTTYPASPQGPRQAQLYH